MDHHLCLSVSHGSYLVIMTSVILPCLTLKVVKCHNTQFISMELYQVLWRNNKNFVIFFFIEETPPTTKQTESEIFIYIIIYFTYNVDNLLIIIGSILAFVFIVVITVLVILMTAFIIKKCKPHQKRITLTSAEEGKQSQRNYFGLVILYSHWY